MNSQPHPTHARYTRLFMTVVFTIAVISWIAGYYAQESLKDQFLVNVFVSTFMIASALLMLAMLAIDKFSRCPECKGWLRSRGVVSEGGTRIFTCINCEINWDAKIKVSGAGEV